MTNHSILNATATSTPKTEPPSVSQSPLASGFPSWDLVPPAILVRRKPKPTRVQDVPPLPSGAAAQNANTQPPPLH